MSILMIHAFLSLEFIGVHGLLYWNDIFYCVAPLKIQICLDEIILGVRGFIMLAKSLDNILYETLHREMG